MHSFIYIVLYNYLLGLEASTGAKSETSGLCIQKSVCGRGDLVILGPTLAPLFFFLAPP